MTLIDSRRSTVTGTETDAFVEQAFAAFDRADAVARTDDQRLEVAGRAVRVRYVGERLRSRFAAALGAGGSAPADPELTICCWDGSATPVPLPRPPWRPCDFLGDSRIRGHITGPLVATYDADARLFHLMDRPGRRALLYVADSADLPAWHDRSPFRPLFALWAESAGLALMHGSSVGRSGSAVVVAGVSGAGKSTTATTCLRAGMDILGDDACLIDAGSGTVSSLYGKVKLEPDAAARWEDLSHWGAVTRGDSGDTILSPRHVTRAASVEAILLSSVGHQPLTELSGRVPPGEAFEALVETSREENHGLTPAAGEALRVVAATIPVHRLTLGTDPDQLVAVVEGLLT